MSTARIIRTHDEQIIELPHEISIDAETVEVIRQGDSILLVPVRQSWQPLIDSLSEFTEDFLSDGRPVQLKQELSLK